MTGDEAISEKGKGFPLPLTPSRHICPGELFHSPFKGEEFLMGLSCLAGDDIIRVCVLPLLGWGLSAVPSGLL